MGVTLWRWTAGVALACAALAVIVPFPTPVAERWVSPVPQPLERETRRFASDVARTQATVRAYRSAVGLELWRRAARASDTTSVRIDQSVPGSIAAGVRAVVSEQWRTLGNASAQHAEVFVYIDSTPVERSPTAAASRRQLDRRGFVDVTFALPEATNGTRCVSMVRLLGTSQSHVDALRHQPLVGICGFFAVFGLPGTANREWLTAVDYRFARRSDWHVAMAPVTDAAAVYGISAISGRCLTGVPGACLDLIGAGRSSGSDRPATGELDFVLDGYVPVSAVERIRPVAELRTVEGELLMSAVREFGPERFARFWTATTAPDTAFAAATGVTLGAWTQRWMRRTFGDTPEPPTARVSHVIWLVASAPLLLLIAARPRERVRD